MNKHLPTRDSLQALASAVLSQVGAGTLATAESCTGGQIAAALTSIPGSSSVFVGGIVAYSEAAKIKLLDVEASLIATHGVVSAEVAMAMAEGARRKLAATFALSTTGVAGPSGGSAKTPVGTVFIGFAGPGGVVSRQFAFEGSRADVTGQAVVAALDLLLSLAK
jgi:PncC family amidohydrolase